MPTPPLFAIAVQGGGDLVAVAGRKREGGATARDPGLGRWAPGSLRRVQRPTAADVTPHSTTNFPNSHKLLALLLCAALGHHTAPSSTSLAAHSSPRWASWSPVSSVLAVPEEHPEPDLCPVLQPFLPASNGDGLGAAGMGRWRTTLRTWSSAWRPLLLLRASRWSRCCWSISAQLREFLRTCRGRERGVALAPPPQALRITEPDRLTRIRASAANSSALRPTAFAGREIIQHGGRDSIWTRKPWSFVLPGDVAVPLT